MNGNPIRPSEEEILVFISSRQDEEVAKARNLAIETVDGYPGFRVWAFEEAPASSESARDRYIRNAGKAEIVIWLVGSTTSTPIVEEINACLEAGSKLLPFMLPAKQRDDQTRELIDRVQTVVTWRQVENVEQLSEHIQQALTDELLRGFRDPAPMNHDQFLKNKLLESVADTRRLWTTLGVPNDTAEELAQDRSIGHKLQSPSLGITRVTAVQGSGKTLAGHRLYQHAIAQRIKDHLQPLPMFLNARQIGENIRVDLEDVARGQGSVYTQPLLVVIDGLDEVGRYKGNQILNQATSLTEANERASVVVLTRSMAGLKDVGNSAVLPECTTDEFVSITSRVAGRNVDAVQEIPYRLLEERNPLFAVIVGTHLRETNNLMATTPSEMVSLLARRIIAESDDYPEETAELLKKLAVATVNSGESTLKSTVALTATAQGRLANSRLVEEQNGKFDFAMAIFREWFAARALVEKTLNPTDIDLTSDRWVVPIALAINSENPATSTEIMEVISVQDPGIASLVLEEVKYSWSTDRPTEVQPPGTAAEIGLRMRKAMYNWQMGLGPLMPAIGPITSEGTVPTLLVGKGERLITLGWGVNDLQGQPVVEMPEGMDLFSAEAQRDWPRWQSTEIEPTRVWPWTTTKEELSSFLSKQLQTLGFSLGTEVGVYEHATEFVKHSRRLIVSTRSSAKVREILDWLEEWLGQPGRGTRDAISFNTFTFTAGELELIHTKLSELSNGGAEEISEPWPGPDKQWPDGRPSVQWHELYTEKQLIARTTAIFDGALRIYNDIVEQWFTAFDRRGQMTYMLPLRFEGILCPGGDPAVPDGIGASLLWWPRLVSNQDESGVSFELGSWDQLLGAATNERLQTAQKEFFDQRGWFSYSTQVLPGYEPRPATTLAHDWLTSDLRDLRWL